MKSLPTSFIRILAESERLMDEGKIPYVMARSPFNSKNMERLPVPQDVMDKLNLRNGQSINDAIFQAIVEESQKTMMEMLKRAGLDNKLSTDSDIADLADFTEKVMDDAKAEKEIEKKLDENFDFRKMMEDGDEPTKH